MLRSTSFWRGLLLVLACLALLANGRVLWQLMYANGDLGVTLPQGLVGPIIVAPDSSAYTTGARTGDVIDGRALSNAARYRLWSPNYLAGETLQLPLRKSTGIHVVDVVAARAPPQRFVALAFAYAAAVWGILFGALLAWRRSDTPDARILALLLNDRLMITKALAGYTTTRSGRHVAFAFSVNRLPGRFSLYPDKDSYSRAGELLGAMATATYMNY